MEFKEEDVKKVATLARLGLADEEITTLKTEMTNILSYIEQLNSLDTSGIEPCTSLLDINQQLREDETVESLSIDDTLKNAPKSDGSYFIVPKIL